MSLPNVPILDPSGLHWFVLALQNEWTNLSRFVPNVGPLLAPIEVAIREKFIPAHFGTLQTNWRVTSLAFLERKERRSHYSLSSGATAACYATRRRVCPW